MGEARGLHGRTHWSWACLLMGVVIIQLRGAKGGRLLWEDGSLEDDVLKQQWICPLAFNASEVAEVAQVCSTISSLSTFVDCCERATATVQNARGILAAQQVAEEGRLMMDAAEADSCTKTFIHMLNSFGANGTIVASHCWLDKEGLLSAGGGCNLFSTLPQLAPAANLSSVAESCFKVVSLAADDPLAAFPSDRACRSCISAVNSAGNALEKVAKAKSTGILGDVTAGACTEAVKVAVTAQAVQNQSSMAVSQCLSMSNFKIGPQLPASAICNSIDWNILDFEAAYQSCGPPQVHNNSCCTVLSGMVSLAVMPFIKTTGNLLLSRSEAIACETTFEAALKARGIEEAAFMGCNLDNVFPQTYTCNNYTTPNEFVNSPQGLAAFDTDCGVPVCSEDCWVRVLRLARGLAGGLGDQLPVVSGCLSEAFMVWGSQHANNLSRVASTFSCFAHVPQELTIQPNLTYLAARGPFSSPPIAPRKDKKPLAVQGRPGLTTWVWVGAVVVGTLLALLVVAGVLICLSRRYWTKATAMLPYEAGKVGSWGSWSSGGGALKMYTLAELETATGGFSQGSKLGGEEGATYKGQLADGYTVAVKEVKLPEGGSIDAKNFVREARYLATLEHPHLAPVRGVCTEGDRRLLVYDFYPQGSLRQWLDKGGLHWPLRLKAAQELARGLLWLHECCKPPLAHGGVSSSNVFVDGGYRAMLAEVGLCLLTWREANSKGGAAGGYTDPACAATGNLTATGDIYSLGVVLFELVAGRRPVDPAAPAGRTSLVEWAWWLAEEGKLLQMADPRLEPLDTPAEVHLVLQVALLCVDTDVERRPAISQVCRFLELQELLPAGTTTGRGERPAGAATAEGGGERGGDHIDEAELWSSSAPAEEGVVSLARAMGGGGRGQVGGVTASSSDMSDSSTSTPPEQGGEGGGGGGWCDVELAAAPLFESSFR